MSGSHSLRRRRFLQAAAALPGVSCSRSGSPWRFLTADEARTLSALCEQIIPTDQDPGAAWAGVVNFIDRQLAGQYRDLQQAYRDGLAEIDRRSTQQFGRRFADLEWDRQTELLKTLEKEKSAFFALVVTHTMQGYYGDPRHGGNRDRVSWRMLGIPFPPVRGRLKYPDEASPAERRPKV